MTAKPFSLTALGLILECGTKRPMLLITKETFFEHCRCCPYAIQDTPEVVANHYGRFLPQDKSALAAKILNQVWEAA